MLEFKYKKYLSTDETDPNSQFAIISSGYLVDFEKMVQISITDAEKRSSVLRCPGNIKMRPPNSLRYNNNVMFYHPGEITEKVDVSWLAG